MDRSPWTEHPIVAETVSCCRFGPLCVWWKSHHDELWMAYDYSEAEDPDAVPAAEPPDEAGWSRWVLTDSPTGLRFSPLFPDRPVVVKPEYSFLLTSRAEARIYVRCPLWVRVELSGASPLLIEEIPSVTLSSTWFGAFTEGDLCYWISSAARRRIEPDLKRPFLAICPIRIINQANEELKVENICLRVANLSLFMKDGQLWADEATFVYRGDRTISEIRVAGAPPPEAREGERVAPPRELKRKGFAAKSFATLKELPGLGFLSQ